MYLLGQVGQPPTLMKIAVRIETLILHVLQHLQRLHHAAGTALTFEVDAKP